MSDSDGAARSASGPRKRPRSSLDAAALATILAPIIDSKGKRWLQYDETKLAIDAKTDVPMILAAGDLLSGLHAEHLALVFKRSVVQAAIKLELERRNERWGLSAEQCLDYVETMSRRLVNICRVVSQALRKKTPPRWTAQLPWIDAPPPATKEEAPAVAVVYHYGYDAFARAAWRQDSTKPKSIRELSTAWEDGADKDPLSAAVAVWSDGSKKAIAQITCGDIVAMQSGRASNTSGEATCYWTGQHSVTFHRLQVKLRADRGLLCSLVEQTSQICSTQVKLFAGPQETEEDEGPRNRAAQILVTIAEAYAANKIAKDELYQMRDKLYAEKGIVGGKRLTKKTADTSCKASVAPAAKKATTENSELESVPMPSKGTRVKPRAKATVATEELAAKITASSKTPPPTAMASPMFSSDEE